MCGGPPESRRPARWREIGSFFPKTMFVLKKSVHSAMRQAHQGKRHLAHAYVGPSGVGELWPPGPWGAGRGGRGAVRGLSFLLCPAGWRESTSHFLQAPALETLYQCNQMPGSGRLRTLTPGQRVRKPLHCSESRF